MPTPTKVLTPIKAMRAKCLDCCCGAQKEVRLCPVQKCPLYPYRMGHRPKVDTDTPEVTETQNHQIAPLFLEKNSQ